MEYKLTILIPTYREEKRIGPTLEALAEYLNKKGIQDTTEVFVYDSASPDGTERVARSKAHMFSHFRFDRAVDHPGPVKGRDVKEGMMRAHGNYILFMDADQATPLHHIDELLAKIEQGSKIIIGVRDVQKIHKGLFRKLLSWGGNILVQLLLLPGIKDTQAGFKCFENRTAREVFKRVTIQGWTFDMEALAIAKKVLKVKIDTIELPDWKDVAGGTLTPGATVAIKSLKDLIKIRLNLWLKKYRPRP